METLHDGLSKNDHHGKANRDTHAGNTLTMNTDDQYHAVRVTVSRTVTVREAKEMPFPLHTKPAGPRVTRGTPR